MEQQNKWNFLRVSQLITARDRRILKHSWKIQRGKFYCSTNIYAKKSQYIVDIKSLTKFYLIKKKWVKVLDNINLSIKQGEFVFIKGKSGSGKTTLINIISGLIKPSTGDVLINNYNIAYVIDNFASTLRSIFFGFVFQSHNFIHLLTLKENIYLSSDLITKKRRKMTNRIPFNIYELCDSMLLDTTLLNSYPFEVSGGQLQRANLVRAMINNPLILLCDEPTSSLDKSLSLMLLKLLKQIKEKYQTTIIFITHDDTICKLGDKVISLENGKIKDIKINNNPIIPSLEDW